MSAGLYSGEPTGDPAGVPCDPECWSESSKRSVAYLFPPRPYRDKAYTCWRCGAADVFTAAEQKCAFEVRKANISQARALCRACHSEFARLKREARACESGWHARRAECSRDPAFLRRWLAALESLPSYGLTPQKRQTAVLRQLLARHGGA